MARSVDEWSPQELNKLQKKNKRLKALLQKYKQQHHLQHALILLSEQASTIPELCSFYPAIQRLLADYVPSKNFYVVLRNPDTGLLELSYFVDQKDGIQTPLVTDQHFEQGVTGYVFRSRATAYFTRETMTAAQQQGKFKILGAQAEHWLGVPIYQDTDVIGVMVSQSYDAKQGYSQEQIELFEVIALYLATAIERVKKRELLESQVKQRTQALTLSNQALNDEISQRKKALERQQTLFQISELASQSINIDDVYYHVHQIMKSITYAENLYIALYDKDNNWLTFPYAVDECSEDFGPRPFAKGFSELVLTSKQCQLIDRARSEQLIAEGIIERQGKLDPSCRCTSWLGAPLKTAQGVIGLIVCQAYNNKYDFVQEDVELIAYVSNQIANVLQNHLSQQALRQSHQELELRVAEKTRELRQANLHLQLQIDERRKIEQQLYHDAHHDSLTGLPNRSLFLSQLERTLGQYQRFPEKDFAVLFIDLDKFKDINDKLGHQCGDQFLIEVADKLKQCIRDHDLIARLGGDEFVILLTQLNERQQAEDVAKRIIAVMQQPFCNQGVCIQSGASIGITYSKRDYSHTDEIIRDADAAMYYAKQTGKGRFEFYHPLLGYGNDQQEPHQRHHLMDLHTHFRASDIVNFDQQQPHAQLLDAYGEHPVLGSTSFEQLKRFASDNYELAKVELKLLKYGFNQHQSEIMSLLNCSSLLLDDKHFEGLSHWVGQLTNKDKLCLLFSEAELRFCSANQMRNLDKLYQQGLHIGLNEFGKDRCELSLLTQLPYFCVLLNATFSRRVLQDPRYDHMLQGVLAVTQLNDCMVIAKGPCILNYRSLLEHHGVHHFIGQQHAIAEQQPLHAIPS
ncbi:diguanylate cyclase [Pseudoalteromonas sp. MM17-2]|uniref:sensor domain-containing diguanylate cyclase n=1 Tax=Pseudoalteromonas sp. MM17-2 TaxID=2917753 RepID=UPI001EF4339A|nr:diguanylate cyclase [Pseudoalteromonas sp. MM17-2]MCG7543830.1 diguanylate cyclase [Pseudoalteromonas sp. MM17-2]